MPKGLNDILGTSGSEKIITASNASEEAKDAVNLTPHHLAEIFDRGPAQALPPVQELFEQVAQLVIGR